VPRFSRVWWVWCTAVFTGGVAAVTRFDQMVRDTEAERANGAKH